MVFRVPLDFPNVDLAEEVRRLVHQVPEGKVTTYGLVAEALGDKVASRFVGKVMSENDDIVRVPCRRVVQSDGTIGGYSGGEGVPTKKKLLRKEGISIKGDAIVDFEKVLFRDFETDFPLRKFKRIQLRDSKNLVAEDDYEGRTMAGADIAYSGDDAFAALVVFDRKSGKVSEVRTARARARFPYIPTYLSFREAPIIERLLRDVDEAVVLAYDGNGAIHPLGFGVSSHIGVLLDVPTIGVAKRLLCGEEKGTGSTRRVVIGKRLAGFSVRKGSSGRPAFVSPGHRITAESALDEISRYWRNRIPEPTRVAHIEAGKARGDGG